MPLSLKDLTTPPTEEDLINQFLGVLALAGFPVTQWQVGGVARTLLRIIARGCASLAQLIAKLAAAGFNSTAAGDWLTLLSREVFQNDRSPATFASGTARLALSSSLAGPYTITVGQLRFTWNKKTYKNTSGGTLTYPATLDVGFIADSPGSTFNAPDNALTLLTPLAGMSVSLSSVTSQGTDQELDPALREKNAGMWGTVGSTANSAGYATWARQASAQVTRVRVTENDPVDGHVKVRIAGPSGALAPEVVGAVQTFLEPFRALCVTLLVVSADNETVPVVGEIRISSGHPNAGNAPAQVNDALNRLAQAASIGGTLDLSDLYAAIEGVAGVSSSLLSAPAGDTTVGPDHVPVLAISLSTRLV
jgi:uncharacterized phage protein gp47/JayE